MIPTASSTIVSASNTFENCYTAGTATNGGSIFYLNSLTSFSDSGSIFQYNSALDGGCIYCASCTMTLSSTKFYSNTAINGASIYMTGNP